MSADDPLLPRLREDLQIFRGGASYSGAPAWLVLDPVRHRFFRITFEMFQVLSVWNTARSLDGLAKALQARYGSRLEPDDIGAMMSALDASFFLDRTAPGSWRRLHESSSGERSFSKRVLHGYLFFKIPLAKPEPFLRATWPYVSFMFTRAFLFAMALAGLLGLYLVSRQWERFLGTFPYVFSLEGAAVSVLSIIFVKSIHELGHGFVAFKYGCRVPTMGVAFMVMFPMLYTDVTDAWRLRSRGSRLAIDAAGIMAELCVAVLALVAWAFLPDGPLRSAAFVLAATSWIMSLLINISPFTRFDGYYVLSDYLGIENLQSRAFRHLRWRIRELLFGLGRPAPDPFPARLDATVTIYAVCAAIYRLFLYVAIALIVYHFTIKLIGVLLFAIEVWFFILRPVFMEFGEWRTMWRDILASRRTYVTLAVLAALTAVVAIPWSTRVSIPAVMMPQNFARLFPEEAGRVEQINIKRGDAVGKDDVLFVLSSPALVQERRLTEIEIELARQRLSRIGSNADDLVESGITQARLRSLVAKRDGLAEREAKLVIRAPFAGRIADLNSEIAVGQWVSRDVQFAFLSGGGGLVARGYLAGDDRGRIDGGASGWFIPDDLSQPRRAAELRDIAVSGAQQLDIPQLASDFGGPIAVRSLPNGSLVPVGAQYAVSAEILSPQPPAAQTERGVLHIEGQPESFLARSVRQVLKVLVREAGA